MRQSPLLDRTVAGRFPARCRHDHDGLQVVFQDVPASGFTDSFSDWTTARLPGPRVTVDIPPEEIDRLGDGDCEPAGLIFHVARCGSTLVAQSLKAVNGLTIYAEPLSFNDILMPPTMVERTRMLKNLRAIGRLLSQHAQGPYLIKLRSWNTLFAEMLTAAFPRTPWLFITRNPVEVAVSVLAKPPTWLRARSEGLNPFQEFVDVPTLASDEIYVAAMFAAFCREMRRIKNPTGLFVDYAELPAAVPDRIAPHFHFTVSDSERETMAEIGRFYSKAPAGEAVTFKPDGFDKTAAATPALFAAVRAHASDAWTSLSSFSSNLRSGQ